MKTIADIYEKLKIDDAIPDVKFPIDGSIEETIYWLEIEGFKEEIYKEDILDTFNSAKSKCYIKGAIYGEFLWFADTSKEKISKKNPIFIKKKTNYGSYGFFVAYFDNKNNTKYPVYDNREKFLEELNKRFNLK